MSQANPPNRKKQPLTNAAVYSGMAIQMAVTIAAGIFGGMKLDQYFPVAKFPVFTLSLSLLSIFAAMYFAIRRILKK